MTIEAQLPDQERLPPEIDSRDGAEPLDELFIALGRLVFEFGQLEEALHDALWMALGGRDEVRILSAGLGFRQLLERFRALYAGFRDPVTGAAAGVDDLCALLDNLNTERNREVHSVWGFWADNGRPARMRRTSRRGSLALKLEAVEPHELLALAERMRLAAVKVWEVALDYERQRQMEETCGESLR